MAVIKLAENYYEIIDSESPSTAEFKKDASTANMTFLIKQDQLLTFFDDVLGSAVLVADGLTKYVDRVIPASHPLFPWMYANRIVSVKGYTPDGNQKQITLQDETTYKNIVVNAPPYTGSYTYYKVTVQFRSRNYNIYDNATLAPHVQQKTYQQPYKNSTNGFWQERPATITDRQEYLRYVNWDSKFDIQVLTYGGGNYWAINGPDGAVGDLRTEFPIQNDNGGVNNFKLTRQDIDINWYWVPFALTIRNQFWLECYGKLNYYDFLGNLFPKGSLLLKEIRVNKYPPYYPFETIEVSNASTILDYYNQYNKNQYCDITFKCSYYSVSDTQKVIPAPITYKPLTSKLVRSAHNMLPYPRDNNYYYFESSVDEEKASPLYWASPFETLFLWKESA